MNSDMNQIEDFKKILQGRVKLFCLLMGIMGLMAAAMAVLSHGTPAAEIGHIPSFIRSAQIGIIIGLEMVFIFWIARYNRAIKNEQRLQALYAELTDERKAYIRMKMSTSALWSIIGCTMTALVISGFFNSTVFLTLLCVLYFEIFVAIGMKIYYHKKI